MTWEWETAISPDWENISEKEELLTRYWVEPKEEGFSNLDFRKFMCIVSLSPHWKNIFWFSKTHRPSSRAVEKTEWTRFSAK